jgi:PPOX class probable F420-dependent enzyme
MSSPPAKGRKRLKKEKNIWLATVRPNGRPHLTPVWFAWYGEKLYICIEPESIKGRNLLENPHISLSLEDGSDALICEGTATSAPRPWAEEIVAIFQEKYDWDITAESRYTQLVEITPEKWLAW